MGSLLRVDAVVREEETACGRYGAPPPLVVAGGGSLPWRGRSLRLCRYAGGVGRKMRTEREELGSIWRSLEATSSATEKAWFNGAVASFAR
uniref:Uncharacterized protein n=1 Tax=Oryza nivara TaxID=4536 RepID=A0A0E0FMB4_ORYNI